MPIYLQHGNLIDYVPPTDTSTEDVVFMGGLVGIPQTFIPAGELGALSVDGVYMFTKKDGVSVNLGEVVKYCGTTKLAQDSNADLTLGVAVADAEADSLGVKVKINSVLPTDGGGGGGGGDGLQNLATGTGSLSILGEATTSEYSTTIGYYANASGCSTIAIGYRSEACGYDTLALGTYAGAGESGTTAIGGYASARGVESTALGANTSANGNYSTALGANTSAIGNYSTALGVYASANGNYSTALGVHANIFEQGATVISAWNDDGTVKTQLYLIGAGSTMSTTYCDGEAGLGFVFEDSDGEIVKRGTIKLSAIMTENPDTFTPTEYLP